MTDPTTPTDAMVEAMRTVLRQNAQHRLLNQLLADCDLRDMFTAALHHQEPGGTVLLGGAGTNFSQQLYDRRVAATPPEPSALDRAVEGAEKTLAQHEKQTAITMKYIRAALEAIRGNGGGTDEKVTDSCGCVYCDLNVPKAKLKGVAYHEEPDGNLIQCEAPDDRR